MIQKLNSAKKSNVLKLHLFYFYLQTDNKGCSAVNTPVNWSMNYRQVLHLHYIFQVFQLCQNECSLDNVSDSLINYNGNVTKCSCL